MADFILIKDLGRLTDEERQQHMVNVCNAAGLDPKLGLLKYTMMDDGSGSGKQRLVLYATKGATNAIRDIKGIDIIALTDKVVGNAVVFTATAKNKNGRTDMAVGAGDIGGKKGKQLEDAFAKAQTKATRRVTLQMSGLDLLDESEVFSDDKTVSINDAPVPLSEIGLPVEISGAAGTDITGLSLKTPVVEAKTLYKVPGHVGMRVEVLKGTEVIERDPEQTNQPEPERVPNPAIGLKPARISMAAPDGVRPATEAPPTTPAVPAVVEAAPAAEAPTDAPIADKPARRKRRTKAEMEASRSGASAPVEMAPAAPATTPAATPEQAAAILATIPEDSAPVAEVVPAVEEAPKKRGPMIGNMPTADQMKIYVDKLTKYRQDILPSGGMVPSHGMGVNKKIREFFKVANNNCEELNLLTVEQWENTFRFMDETAKTAGVKKLVEIIDYNIGASDEAASVAEATA